MTIVEVSPAEDPVSPTAEVCPVKDTVEDPVLTTIGVTSVVVCLVVEDPVKTTVDVCPVENIAEDPVIATVDMYTSVVDIVVPTAKV